MTGSRISSTLTQACGVLAAILLTLVVPAAAEAGTRVTVFDLVTTPGKTVTGGEMWGGRPAKKMRALSDAEIANFDWSVAGYCERAGEFRDELAALAKSRGVAAE